MCATLYRINWEIARHSSQVMCLQVSFTVAPVEFAMWSRRQIKGMLECLSQRIAVAFNHGGR
jgi:hypothetical protein